MEMDTRVELELEPVGKEIKSKDQSEDERESEENQLQLEQKNRLTPVKIIPAQGGNADLEETPRTPPPMSLQPGTSRQLFREAALAHGGQESTSLLQQELNNRNVYR